MKGVVAQHDQSLDLQSGDLVDVFALQLGIVMGIHQHAGVIMRPERTLRTEQGGQGEAAFHVIGNERDQSGSAMP